MWGRKDQEEPARTPSAQPQPQAAPSRPEPAAKAAPSKGAAVENHKAVIGPSIQVKGELIGNEDLVVEGKVEGVVRLTDHHLVIGKSAQIDATLEAKSIRIEGTVRGDVVASERVELAAGGGLTGDIAAPRMMIADGAKFKGSVDMDRKLAQSGAAAPQGQQGSSSKPATAGVGASSNKPANPSAS
jgi:cytoskeletal protein CcmA (bactofilin family)